MDVQAIQQAMANAAATILGMQGLPSLTDSIDPPTFAVSELECMYDQTFHGGGYGLVEITFTAAVFASRGDSEAGRKALNGYLAPSGAMSVKAALESDRTLAGATKTLQVTRTRGAYRIYTIGATDYLGALLDVQVWA